MEVINIKITIICIGKIKEKYLISGIEEYIKRLSKYCDLKIVELNESKLNDDTSIALVNQVKIDESNKILAKINKDSYKIVLDPKGKNITNEKYVEIIEEALISGKSEISFIIGGSYGLSNELIQQADLLWSFSNLVFTHQMIRLVLLEQIYRGFKIMKNEPYHK